jgi:hypothetical protein
MSSMLWSLLYEGQELNIEIPKRRKPSL